MIGRIYRIIHLQSEICYIGSTFSELRKRWQNHKRYYGSWLNNEARIISIYPLFKQYGIDKFKMILIKEYEVVDRKHLGVYEQLWINKFRKTCVNKQNTFVIKSLSEKDYRGKNKEKIAQINKEYRENNKEKIARKKKEFYENNKEKIAQINKEFYENNKEKIARREKEYREKNKEVINAKRKEKFDCECGSIIRRVDKARHERTKKHTDWLASQ